MSTIKLKLLKLPDEPPFAGAKVAIGLIKLSKPSWAPAAIGTITSECFCFQELESQIEVLQRDLAELRREGKIFFDKQKKRRSRQVIKTTASLTSDGIE